MGLGGPHVLLHVGIVLGLGLAAAKVALRRRGRGRRREGAGAEADPVPLSGKLIAAWRAVESLEPDALFTDPFAAAVAGSAAVHEVLEAAKPFTTAPQTTETGAAGATAEDSAAGSSELVAGAAPTSVPAAVGGLQQQQQLPQRRRFCYSNVGVRVWWFDQQLLAALAGSSPPRQVVVLGAGFDTRPWRLALPAGTRWYEVDQPQVVAAKKLHLEQLGAGFNGASSRTALHPLHAACWAAMAADLRQPGWTKELVSQGLDPRRPVIWVAEGLLMYLTGQEQVAALQEMSGISPRGSVLIAHQITRELHSLVDQGEASYSPFPPELVATWHSSFPPASDPASLAAELAEAGWPTLLHATSRARIAAQVCSSSSRHRRRSASAGVINSEDSGSTVYGGGGSSGGGEEVAAQCDFETRVDEGRDRWAVFFTAAK